MSWAIPSVRELVRRGGEIGLASVYVFLACKYSVVEGKYIQTADIT